MSASRQAFAGRLLRLRVDTLVVPSGRKHTHEVVEHPGAVAIVALLDDATILLVRQFRLPARQDLLEVPAGTLEEGERPSSCARRELAEEVGYRPGRLLRLGSFYTAPGYCEEVIHAFLASDLKPHRARPEPDEYIEVEAVPFDAAVEMAAQGKLRDAKSIAAILMAAPRVARLASQGIGERRQARHEKASGAKKAAG